ncbi:MAG: hypothetical protein AB2770_13205 [Candidatus Thiodiazotropha taylori]
MKELNTGSNFIRVFENENMSFDSLTDLGEEEIEESTTHIEYGISRLGSVMLFGTTKFEDPDLPDALTIIKEVLIEDGSVYYRGDTILQDDNCDEYETLIRLDTLRKRIPLSEINLTSITG